jgi:hypothetical protein
MPDRTIVEVIPAYEPSVREMEKYGDEFWKGCIQLQVEGKIERVRYSDGMLGWRLTEKGHVARIGGTNA